MKPNPLTNLWPIGHIAQHAGASVSEVETIADEMKLEPVIWICGVPYFNMLQAIPIQEEIEHRRTGAPKLATEAMERKVARSNGETSAAH